MGRLVTVRAAAAAALLLLFLTAAIILPSTNAAAATTQADENTIKNKSNEGDTTSYDIPTFQSSNEEKKASDYANYFSAYADLYHQKIMLTDHHRMEAYYNAIMSNRNVFKDKVVMDVGSGSGILAVWAAQAGAKRVYAVEYTDMAKHARKVVQANGLQDVVTVIQGAVEDVKIPKEDWETFGLKVEDGEEEEEQCSSDNSCNSNYDNSKVVDIIISEWMGYFLLRESMLDSVIRARELFLKPTTGILLPSHATMLIAPISNSQHHHAVLKEYTDGMDDWHTYLGNVKEQYGVDMSILEDEFEKEQREYYLLSSHWVQLGEYDETILDTPVVVKTLDMKSCTLEDARGVDLTKFAFNVASVDEEGEEEEEISGFAGWFTVDFQSSADEVGKDYGMKMMNPVHFTSSPEIGDTHWGQMAFYFPSPIKVPSGGGVKINGSLEMKRAKQNARLYNVHFNYTVGDNGDDVEAVYQLL